jgi:hypothetical protein
MKGDFSRDTFDPVKHYSRVLMQQGRVQLDTDWNEQTAILTHYLRALAHDLIGDHAGPIGDLGFKIETCQTLDGYYPDLKIGRGRYYVDGILCEAEDCRYYAQPHLQLDPAAVTLFPCPYLVYLDVWERHVTFLEDDHIREVALNGSDTATRAQVVWQVKVTDKCYLNGQEGDLSNNTPDKPKNWPKKIRELWEGWLEHWQSANRGSMSAWTKKPGAEHSLDPCNLPPDARYRGDNRLYRVEIHKGGEDGQAIFNWSRDNGSVVAALDAVDGQKLHVRGVRDVERGFASGQWVEVLDRTMALRQEPGTMYKLGEVEGDILTVAEWYDRAQDKSVPVDGSYNIPAPDHEQFPVVRRWDGPEPQIIGKNARREFELERGIWITFGQEATYRTGDYWLIPARTATGDVEWPRDDKGQPVPHPPHGVMHHYAPLAIVFKDVQEVIQIAELRTQFTCRLSTPQK